MRGPRMLGGIALSVAALLAPLAAPATAGPAHQVAAARAATQGFSHPPAATPAGYALRKDIHGIA